MGKNKRFWELLGKLTSGEASEEEQKALEQLLDGNESNIQYMVSTMDHYWESIEKVPDPLENPSLHVKKHRAGLRKFPEAPRREPKERVTPRKRKSPLVLGILMLLLAGGWFAWHTYRQKESDMNIVSTRNGSKTKVTLPDGTQVWLNADSRLSYPNDFQHGAEREVFLSGEAYFDVVHNAERPFIIHTQYLDIKDIGTAFNVKAYPDEDESEATLVTGAIKVSLHQNPDKSFILKPREKFVYYATGNDVALSGQKKNAVAAKPDLSAMPLNTEIKVTHLKSVLGPTGDSIITETAWMNNQLVFDSEKLSSLARRMARWYNVEFEITDKNIANYTFTGIFDGETLEQALLELQMIRPFKYSISKDVVVISK